MTERETGRPRGFAFVEMSTEAEAKAAVEQLSGRELGGRTLSVNEAQERSSGGGNRSSGGAAAAVAGGAQQPPLASKGREPEPGFPAFFLRRSVRPSAGSRRSPFGDQDAPDQVERPLDEQRQDRGGDRPLQDQRYVVEANAREDRLPETAGADQRTQRRGPDVDHRRALDAGQDGPQRQRQLDRQRIAPRGRPSASADSRSAGGMAVSPACVFRTIGSRL